MVRPVGAHPDPKDLEVNGLPGFDTLTERAKATPLRLPTVIPCQGMQRLGMIRAEEGPHLRERKVSRLDFREESHTREGPQQAIQGRGMGPCHPGQVRTASRSISHQIREVQLRRDTNRCRDPVSRHEMVELYVRCRLTQPLQIRLALDSLTHHSVPPFWVESLCAPERNSSAAGAALPPTPDGATTPRSTAVPPSAAAPGSACCAACAS